MSFRSILHQLRNSTVYRLTTRVQSSIPTYSQPCLTTSNSKDTLTTLKPADSSTNSQPSLNEMLSNQECSLSTGEASMAASVDWLKLQNHKLATVQEFLKAEEQFGIDTIKRREIRAFVRAIHALVDLSVQHGHNNLYVYKRPDAVIKLLIKLGYLPSDSLVGREGFFELTHLVRVSLNVSLYYLMTYEAEIKAAIEDHTDKDADEVFNVLLFSSVIHSSNGGQPFMANVLNHTVSRVNALPRSFRHTVLTGESLLQLASA